MPYLASLLGTAVLGIGIMNDPWVLSIQLNGVRFAVQCIIPYCFFCVSTGVVLCSD